MALGDRVIVLIDLGAGKTREEVVQAGSAGGTVVAVSGAYDTLVQERSRNGRPLREVRVPTSRLIATIEVPKGR